MTATKPPSALLVRSGFPPPLATGGIPFAAQPIIALADTLGFTVTAASGALVTAAIASATPTGGQLRGRAVVPAVRGAAAFTDLSLTAAATYQLVFTSPGLSSATVAVTVAAGPPAALVLTRTSGADGAFALTAAVVDAGGERERTVCERESWEKESRRDRRPGHPPFGLRASAHDMPCPIGVDLAHTHR